MNWDMLTSNESVLCVWDPEGNEEQIFHRRISQQYEAAAASGNLMKAACVRERALMKWRWDTNEMECK